MPPLRASLRVLVVDDNDVIRRLLGCMLEAAGFVAIEAESGEAALELAGEVPPDAWLVDEVMPGMHGSELIRALRRHRDQRLSRAAVVGISGRAGARLDLIAAGADAFVPKPVSEEAILSALSRALEERGVAPDHLPAA
jgi:CheY-like chemotaxis protein